MAKQKFNKNWHQIHVYYWEGKYRFNYTDMHYWNLWRKHIILPVVHEVDYRGHKVFVTVGVLYDYVDLVAIAERIIDDIIDIGEVIAY